VSFLIVAGLGVLLVIGPAHAQDEPQPEEDAGGAVQVLTGVIFVDGGVFYSLPGLLEGQRLDVYMESTSGNLDPFLGLYDERRTDEGLLEQFWNEVDLVIAENRDPLKSLPRIYDDLFVAWDDDSGTGYDAALSFVVPADGDYQLVALSTPTKDTFGEYSLWVGLDGPALIGGAEPTGDEIAIRDEEVTRRVVAVQELTGTLSIDNLDDIFILKPVRAEDMVYAFVEAIEGDFAPVLVLRDFGDKPLSTGGLDGVEPTASLFHQFETDSQNNSLRVFGRQNGESGASGQYRLVIGVNDPDVMTGQAETTEETVFHEPLEVRVGVQLHQITGVDQIAENFGAVATLRMEWQDPRLAFNPAVCQCNLMTLTRGEFEAYVSERGAQWPEFWFSNQQGNRWIQGQNAVVWPDGWTLYVERFTTDFQAPDFDFTRFPFDTQHLYIELLSVFPATYFVYRDSEDLPVPDREEELGALGDEEEEQGWFALEDFTAIDKKLGEEEWFIISARTERGILDTGQESPRAVYILGFEVQRHLNFYIFRILVPIVLIIIVSWITFFLKDYGKRVDVASANLLVFVAFNFTVSGDLPRLGYLTFMDAVLIGVFVISAFVVVFNVILKRLELAGRRNLAEWIDQYSIWVYPLLYAVGGFLAYWMFLR
jgi:hypothetical protein